MSRHTDQYMGPMILDINNKDLLHDLCDASHSYAEVINLSGRKCTGGNYQMVKSKIVAAGIDVSHFTGQLWSKGKTHKDDPRITKNGYSDDDIFGYHPEISRSVVRKYIIRNNTIPYICAICGNTGEWNGCELALHLDHIDGKRYNHSLDNLRFLCPNCDATTPTYTGRNKNNYNNEL